MKFACLVFELPAPFPHLKERYSFDANTDLFKGSVKELIQTSDSNHWKEWVGSIAWDSLNQNSKLILTTWQNSKVPEVLDSENESLQNKLLTIYRILPLVGPISPPVNEGFIFSGDADRKDGKLQFKNIRTYSRVNSWTRSYFSEHYWKELFDWTKHEFTVPELLNSWGSSYNSFNLLFVQLKSNTQILEAFLSFEEAMKSKRLESKITSLFRSIECIVECYGRNQFSQRLISLIGVPSEKCPYGVWHNTSDLLRELYELRNDCCHGKPFAYSLYKKLKGAAPGSLIAKYEFLAEWATRKLIIDSFSNKSVLTHTHKYEDLVHAWEQSLIQS